MACLSSEDHLPRGGPLGEFRPLRRQRRPLRVAPDELRPLPEKIRVKNTPTYFGTVAYEIVSDADHGKISATIEMPSRKAPKEVVLRFRHPKSAPIKFVTVNGKPWAEFIKDKGTITLKGLTGTVAVTAQY